MFEINKILLNSNGLSINFVIELFESEKYKELLSEKFKKIRELCTQEFNTRRTTGYNNANSFLTDMIKILS